MTQETNAVRDPRANPMTGDQVRVGEITRLVVYVSSSDKVVYDIIDSPKGQLVCELSTWRRWAKPGEVVRQIDRMDKHPEIVALDYWQRGQINGLANRCKPERRGTEFDVALLALLEMGIDRALTLGGENELREILKRRLPT